MRYSSFTFIALPLYYHQKLHKLLIQTAHWVNNTYDFKKSTNYIFSNANLLDASQLIVISSFQFIYRIVSTEIPSRLYSQLTFPKRTCNKITIKNKGKHNVSSYFSLSLKVYNEISPEILFVNKGTIKDSLMHWVRGRGTAHACIRRAKAWPSRSQAPTRDVMKHPMKIHTKFIQEASIH